jgi:synapsin
MVKKFNLKNFRSQINLEAYHDSTNVILSIRPNKKPQENTNQHKSRFFQPNFVLIRGLVEGIKPGQDWRKILYGLSFANIPCVNSVDSLISGHERAHVIGKMKQLQKKHGKKKFPLIEMNYYSETNKMQFTPDFPVIVKVGSFEAGFGKMKIDDNKQLIDLGSVLTVYDDYVTVEKFIENRDYDIRIQKIGSHYRAYSRVSMIGNWKTNVGTSVVTPIKMESQFKFWIDECSKMFGGLDILTVDAVHTTNDEYFILEINDCASGFLPEFQEEDMEHVFEVCLEKIKSNF